MRDKVNPRRPGKLPKPPTVKGEAASSLFDRVALEVLHGEREMFDSLSAHEKKLVVQWMSDAIVDGDPNNTVRDLLWEIDYVREPVDIETFIFDEYYMGRMMKNLHKNWVEDLKAVFAPGSQIFEWVLTGAIGVGKGLIEGTPLLTPTGWLPVERVEVGDEVIGSDGKPTRVTGVYPQGCIPTYRVTFDDKSELVVDGEHRWSVQTPTDKNRGQDWKVLSTTEIIECGVRNTCGQKRWHIPVLSAPVEYVPVELPFPAYALGALIGNGGLTGGGIKFRSNDDEVVEEVCGATELTARHIDGCDYRLVREGERGNPAFEVLRGLGVCCRSDETRIPPIYLRASVEDRLALLRGLMDTDGWIQNRGKSSLFCTPSEGLANDTVEIVRSLGGIATVNLKTTTHLDAYMVDVNLPLNPFKLARKADEWRPREEHPPRRMIASIESEHEREVICIAVEAEDELYVADNFIVTHNTTIAMGAMAYKLHHLLCLRNPASYYGLLPESLVVFGIYSITKRQVADTGYFKLRGYLDTSPFFRKEFPRSKKIDSKVDFAPTTKKNIQVVPGSQDLHALGLDLYSFALDEVNFMRSKTDKDKGQEVGQAYDLYNATHTRILSRFLRPGGTIPGIMFLMSSRNSQTSFLETHLKKVRSSAYTYISDYPLWDVKPKHRFIMPKFRVEVGDRISQSRILGEKEKPRRGAKIVEVPGEFRKVFNEDVDQALRDVAGVATFNLSPLVRDRKSVFDCVREHLVHPFTRDSVTIDCEDDLTIDEHYVIQTACRVKQGKWVPKLNPGAARAIHVDLSLTGDCAGIAMGHISGLVRNTKTNPDGTRAVVENPFIVMDFMLRIVPPPGSETDLSKIRSFILYLMELYPVFRVTFDGFQSRDSVQILRKQKVEAGLLSVDKNDEAYLSLRSAHFDRRIAMYDYAVYTLEILDLERDIKKRKVDHPAKNSKGGKGSKDVSDAVAGVVWTLINDDRASYGAVLIPNDTVEMAEAKAGGKTEAQIRKQRQDEKNLRVAASADAPKSVKAIGGVRKKWGDLRKNL